MAQQTVEYTNDATTAVATLLVDEAGGVVIPVSKLVIGADDTNDGFVSSANPMPVTGTVAATQSGTWTVGLSAGQTLATVTTVGTVTTVTTVAAVTAITNALPAGDNNIGNVDVVTLPALAAGTNNIGDVDVLTLPALPAGTNNIGDVDVLTLPALPAGTNNIGDVDILSIAAGDNNIGNVDIASIAAGDNNIGNVDIVSLPDVTVTGVSTLTEQQSQTTHLATIAGDTTSIQTAVELLDDTVATHDSAATSKGTQTALEARSTAPTAVSDGDAVRAQASLSGKAVTLPHAIPGLTWNYAAAAGGLVTTSGVTAKAAGGSGIRNYITSVQVINSHETVSTEVCIKDGAGGTVLHRGYALANGGGYACTFNPPLRGTADTLVEIAEVTQTATAGVLVNLQGYTAAE